MSVPDPLGRDRLAAGAAMYKVPVYGEKPPPPPFYRRPRFVALLIVGTLALSFTVFRLTSSAGNTPEAAATRVIELFLDEEYAELRTKLCSADRSQVGANDLETAGRTAGPLLRTYDKPDQMTVSDVVLQGSFAGKQAKQVSGRILAKVGNGSAFKVVTVNERGGWRVCLSPGGYALTAFNLDVPIGGALEQLDQP